jgi:hypothetical protein
MSFALYYPSTAGGPTVTIRNPEFGDVRRVDSKVVIRDTRSGQLSMAYDTDWPADSVYRYEFVVTPRNATNNLVDALKTFLEDSAADKIRIVDHLGDSRIGVILTPIQEIINVRDECSHNIGFEFLQDSTS